MQKFVLSGFDNKKKNPKNVVFKLCCVFHFRVFKMQIKKCSHNMFILTMKIYKKKTNSINFNRFHCKVCTVIFIDV